MKPLDKLDLAILSALGRLGGKASAESLASILQRSARTIRYRIRRLKKQGYLRFLYAQTHDPSLGLKDDIICYELAPSVSNLENLFKRIPLFYLHSSTYGRFCGHIAHMTYPSIYADLSVRLSTLLEEEGFITRYLIFKNLDYVSIGGDLERLDLKTGWRWDWQEWVRESRKILESKKPPRLEFRFNATRCKFDNRDVEILQFLKTDAGITLRELGQALNLSPTQVNKRIKQMESTGIIKGYRWIFSDPIEPLYLYIFFETHSPNDSFLTCLLNLPFPREIVAESQTKFCFRVKLYPSDMHPFLKGFDQLRGYLRSFNIQFVHRLDVSPMRRFYSYFDATQNDWVLPLDEINKSVREFAKKACS